MAHGSPPPKRKNSILASCRTSPPYGLVGADLALNNQQPHRLSCSRKVVYIGQTIIEKAHDMVRSFSFHDHDVLSS